MTARRSSVALVVLLGVAGCTKKDSLVLLELRASGPLGAPVAHIRLSAHGWPTRMVDASLDAGGLRLGYYGPGDGDGVTVIADALDADGCVLGSGSATAPALKAGATSAPTTLFIRPEPANGCVPDAGMPDGGGDAGEDAGMDVATDVPVDAPMEAGVDVADEDGTDADVDVDVDVGTDGAGSDATVDGGAVPDAEATSDANGDAGD